MIRTTAVPRPARAAAALVGVLGVVTLAGCAGGATGATGDTADAGAPVETTNPAPSSATTEGAADESGSLAGGTYADGTYTAEGSYATPESVESISVTITLADDAVTGVEVVGDPQAAESQRYQSEFIGGISSEVVGRLLDEVLVDRVAGSSLTSGGFMKALDAIKSEAAA